ncbi:DUF6979 family protein [Paenibacillus radicis (ex Xue et al. 2023)]|uniref:Uncharacterized protein n=1 Tax=Paenibacillus radicis (ex Xue et al. 2023) TaxID=2972489 RepID=A0ABT1YL56_9BACL|nr:hypothetical protein [Paenibacillus radicis (ex Xue et al. 2023)]MCR8633919.1 hypothetical protein [Paenibacillus radicis (ex Xue et al. 2023)]
MNKYAQATLIATKLIENNQASTPLEAWNIATTETCGEGTWAQKKGCPKNAFLGLCEAGLVKGISKGIYTERSNSQKNKGYAIKAVELLRENPELAEDLKVLWETVMDGKVMSHNYQMDVVVSLWKHGLICE